MTGHDERFREEQRLGIGPLALRLSIVVTDEELQLEAGRPLGLLSRRVPLADVTSVEVADGLVMRPLRTWGYQAGWGIKRAPGTWVYNFAGNRGVRLGLRGAGRGVVASKRADELATALEAART